MKLLLRCFRSDSLKPFVDVPFTNEATKFFNSNNLDLLEHRSRWGGAVHFALASTRAAASTLRKDGGSDLEAGRESGDDDSAVTLRRGSLARETENYN